MELTVTALLNIMWATPNHGVLLHDAQFKFTYLFIYPIHRCSFKTFVKLVMPLKYLGSRYAAFLPQAYQLEEMLIKSSTLKPFMFCTWLSDLTHCLMVCPRAMHEHTLSILPQCSCICSCFWTFWSLSTHIKIHKSGNAHKNIKGEYVPSASKLEHTVPPACTIWIH